MATETTEAGGKAAESVGMPQLDFSTFSNQIFWLVVAIVVLYFVMSRVALPRIASVLSDRQSTITNDIAAAEDLKQKALDAEAAYNQALIDARAEANRIVEETKAEIKVDLDKAIALADSEIAAKSAESEKAIDAIKASAQESAAEVARDIAQDIVSAVAPGKIDAKAITAAVNARVKG
ncbi:MAG: F0F1 ATP synthase subunit B' [Pseudomonadota bacterium]